MRNCQVVCSFASNRRRHMYGSPTTEETCTDTIIKYIETFNNTDPGVEVDLIIINNDNNVHKHNEYISKLNSKSSTNWGDIITITRPNQGGSFGAYAYAVEQFKDLYDYWVFGEDDCFITFPNYYKKSIEYITNNDNVSYVAYSPIAWWDPLKRFHCGGGLGFTSTEEIFSIPGLNLSYFSGNTNPDFYDAALRLEITWTLQFTHSDKILSHLPNSSPFAENNLRNGGLAIAKTRYLSNPEWAPFVEHPPIFKMYEP